MNLSSDLVPIIYKKDMDKLATEFLLKYCPEALKEPIPLPVEHIAEFGMELEIDYVNIDKNADTLGMMIFSDGIVELYDQEAGTYINRPYKKGTLLVESNTLEDLNRGRERFTIAHELIHWDKHQLRFMALSYQDKSVAKACRCPKEKVSKPKSPEEWIEWQADNLAAAILMPEKPFRQKVHELVERYKHRVGKKSETSPLWYGFPPEIIQEIIIDELAKTFEVSKQATQIRVNTLGIRLL